MLAYLALGVGILSLGFSALFVRWANAPGAVVSFYRMAIATAIMALPYLNRLGRRTSDRASLPRQGITLAIIGGLAFAGDLTLWATGVMISGATNPTLLANTAPLWVGLGAYFLFREPLRLPFWVGLALALTGSLLILGLDSLQGLTFGLGSLLGLLASLFYATYFLITQQGRRTLDSLTYFWISALSSTLALLVLTALLRQPLLGYPPLTYLNFFALGMVTQVFGYLAINFALGHMPASIVSPTMVGQPVVTAILAWVLLGERLSPWHISGAIAVLAGVILVHRAQRKVGLG